MRTSRSILTLLHISMMQLKLPPLHWLEAYGLIFPSPTLGVAVYAAFGARTLDYDADSDSSSSDDELSRSYPAAGGGSSSVVSCAWKAARGGEDQDMLRGW